MTCRMLCWCMVAVGVLSTAPLEAADAPVSSDVIILVDLSPSLARQRGRIAEIGGEILRSLLTRGATFAFYAMESSMGDAAPLLSGRIPAPITTRQTVTARAQFDRWEEALRTAISDGVGNRDRQKLFTSCYVKSTRFASDYFKGRVGSRRIVVWIGDLIEDCRESGFIGFRLSGNRGLDRAVTRSLPSLTGIEAVAVVVPRAPGDPDREVDAATVTAYWKDLAERLGMPPTTFRIGTPDVLGIAVRKRP